MSPVLRPRPALLVGLVLSLAATSVPAQEPTGTAERAGAEAVPVRRVFQIRYADTNDVYHLLSEEMGVEMITVLPASQQVVVEAAPDVLGRIEKWLEQLDVPPNAAVVRIILERAERTRPADDLPLEQAEFHTSILAETTFQVLERTEHTQTFGPDGVFEVRVALAAVDLERQLMHFDRFAISRIQPADPDAGPEATSGGEPRPPERRELLKTSLDLRDRVGKTVMSATDQDSDVALFVRAIGLIREASWEGP